MTEKPKILVVDDESVIIDAARKILSVEGFTVRTALDGERALPLLPAETPDIAFLDLMLPGISGLDLLDRIKRDYPDMVVVMMTGYSTLDTAITFLKNGAFDYLPKPFAYEELLSTARRAYRFIELRREAKTGIPAKKPAGRYVLGSNSWAIANPDGSASLGVTDLFLRMVGPVEAVELPPVNYEIRQGSQLAQVQTRDELRHTVWAALSGRVIEINPNAQSLIELSGNEPAGKNWFVRIIPENLESESLNLAAETVGQGG
jgi:DNA-binding response OmpR family regulator